MTLRPNPFSFPSDTDLRFLLLVASILGASLYVFSLLYLSVPANASAYLQSWQVCDEIARLAYPMDETGRLSAFTSCQAPYVRTQALWTVAGVVVLIIAAVAQYWTYPHRTIWRGQLQPLVEEDDPELIAYLGELVRRAGLKRRPAFLVSPEPTTGGSAFGRLGKYYVALDSGLLVLFHANRAAFRAVVLHELAHLRNSDVDKTYLARALSRSLIFVALLPLVLVYLAALAGSLWRGGAFSQLVDIGRLALPSLALTVSSFLTWAAILRSREYYADLRADHLDVESGGEATGGLARLLERAPQREHSIWQRLSITHASAADRARILVDSRPLFRIGFWDTFAAGMTGMIAFPSLQTFFGLLLSGTSASLWSTTAASLLIVSLTIGIVGVGLWRAVFARILGFGPRPNTVLLALGLWIGMLVGRALSYEAGVFGSTIGGDRLDVSSSLALAGTLLLSLLFFLRWIANGAAAWLPVAFSRGSLRPVYTLGLAVAGALLCLWLGVVFLVAQVTAGADIAAIGTLVAYGLLGQLPRDPLALLAVALVWAYPLAGQLSRRGEGPERVPAWAYLDGDLAGRPVMPPAFGLGQTLRIGLVGGLATGALLFVGLFFLLPNEPAAASVASELGLMAYLLQIGWVMLAQAALAARAASRAEGLRVEQGLLAAFAAGVIQAIFRVAFSAYLGTTLDATAIWGFLSSIIVLGAIAALPVSALAGALGRRHPSPNTLVPARPGLYTVAQSADQAIPPQVVEEDLK